jgi:hypothetical protein
VVADKNRKSRFFQFLAAGSTKRVPADLRFSKNATSAQNRQKNTLFYTILPIFAQNRPFSRPNFFKNAKSPFPKYPQLKKNFHPSP